MKVASHVLLFGQDKWIMRNIENAYPHVDKIYVAHSVKPWTYNSSARSLYSDTFDTNILLNSKFSDKITLIEGEWEREEDQRNACVDAAVKDGIDILLIHDADEFYFNVGLENLISEMKANSMADMYYVPWMSFWKSFKYILLSAEGSEIVGYPEFAINVKRGVRFVSKRRPSSLKSYTLTSGMCFHASFVLTNEEVLRKIETWGHANDFDRNRWYNEVWLKWTPEMTNLHLVSPTAWSKAVEYTGLLPEVISDMR